MAPSGLEESWTIGTVGFSSPLQEIEGLVWAALAIKSRARRVYTQRVYKHTQIQQAANYTVRCVLGILLVPAIINLDQWEATIGWSLLPKYRRCALKSSMWVKCRKATKIPDGGQDVYFCKWWVFAQCSAVLLFASQQQKSFHYCSQSNASISTCHKNFKWKIMQWTADSD